MKNLKKILFIGLITIILGSCTIQKRLYTKGYNIEQSKNYSSNNQTNSKVEISKENDEIVFQEEINNINFSNEAMSDENTNFTNSPTISLKNNENVVIENKVNITDKTKINISPEKSVTIKNSSLHISHNPNEKQDETTAEKGDKSLLIAIILWWFLGIIGFHRFYLGHIGIGILYLLTFGLFGFGWLIDGILFLTGNLKPKKGKYV